MGGNTVATPYGAFCRCVRTSPGKNYLGADVLGGAHHSYVGLTVCPS
uniref:Uncharacterized protein n=1 Tax=Tetraselmis sp. GSL018 TaxID=582737 RepID=A0A061RST6_9CHLO